MQAAQKLSFTPEEYLALERQAEVRSEYFDGEIFAMAGGSQAHSLLASNLIRLLGNALEARPCRVYTSDMRVKVEATGLYTYPDVPVVCGKPQVEDSHGDTLLNPVLLIEVLSPSTERYDRRVKFDHYRKIPSLMEYVLVSQDEMRVERYRRQDNGEWAWQAAIGPDASILLSSIDVSLKLSDIFAKVELPPPAPIPAEARMSIGSKPVA